MTRTRRKRIKPSSFTSDEDKMSPPTSTPKNTNSDTPVLDVKLFLALVPEFKGDSENLHKFLNNCDIIYAPLVHETCKSLFLTLVKAKLIGQAYEVVKYKDFSCWEILKLELKKQFMCQRSVQQLQEELISSKQHDLSVIDFAVKIQKLLAELNEACIAIQGPSSSSCLTSFNEKLALNAFTKGLNQNLSLYIRACRFKSLQEAINEAVEEGKSFKQNSPNINKSKPVQIKCQICNRTGHTSVNCFYRYQRPVFPPKLNNLQNISNQSSTSGQNNPNIITCNYCHKIGHVKSVCRKKMFNEQRRFSPSNSEKPQTSTAIHATNSAKNSQKVVPDMKNTPVRLEDL